MTDSGFPGYAYLPTDDPAADDPVALRAALSTIRQYADTSRQTNRRLRWITHIATEALAGKDWRVGIREAPRMRLREPRVERGPILRSNCEHCDGEGEIEMDNNGPIVSCPVCSPGSVPAKEQGK